MPAAYKLAPGRRGALTWRACAGLDSYALGAGVQPGPRNSAQYRAPQHESRLAWAPRVEASLPHHAGAWRFGGESRPEFVADAVVHLERKAKAETGMGGDAVAGVVEKRAAVATGGHHHDELTQLQDKEEEQEERNEDVEGEPRPEASPPKHTASWVFSGFSGPALRKTEHERHRIPSTYMPGGWEHIFGRTSAPKKQALCSSGPWPCIPAGQEGQIAPANTGKGAAHSEPPPGPTPYDDDAAECARPDAPSWCPKTKKEEPAKIWMSKCPYAIHNTLMDMDESGLYIVRARTQTHTWMSA